MSNVSRVSARYVIMLTIGLLFGPLFLIAALLSEWYLANEFIVDNLVGFASYLAILFLIWRMVNKYKLYSVFWPGRFPGRRAAMMYFGLSIPMVGMALLSIIIFYWPLSFVVPTFVETWLLEDTSFVVFDSDWKSILGSVLSVLVTVLIAPITEEVVFRWLLIERWKSKYSTRVAIILSSMIFAVFHADLLGSFLFGVILSLIYLHTGSLWGPILIHIGNNALVTLVVILDELWLNSPETLTDFQSDWVTPLLSLLLVALWLPVAIRRWPLAKAIWRAPPVITV